MPKSNETNVKIEEKEVWHEIPKVEEDSKKEEKKDESKREIEDGKSRETEGNGTSKDQVDPKLEKMQEELNALKEFKSKAESLEKQIEALSEERDKAVASRDRAFSVEVGGLDEESKALVEAVFSVVSDKEAQFDIFKALQSHGVFEKKVVKTKISNSSAPSIQTSKKTPRTLEDARREVMETLKNL